MAATRFLRGSVLGLLAMFGASTAGTLPAFNVGVLHRTQRPASVQEWLKGRARAKRIRRAENPYASSYARTNVR